MHYSIIGISIAVACIILASIFIVIFVYLNYIKRVKTNGLAIFKLDFNQRKIIRLSQKNISGSLNFDSKKQGLSPNQYVDFDTFLSYFDDESKNNLIEYLSNNSGNDRRFNIYCKMSSKGFKNHQDFSGLKLLNIKMTNEKILLKFFPIANNEYYITIHWNAKPRRNASSVFQFVKKPEELFNALNKGKYILAYALGINEFLYNNIINKSDIEDILKIFKLNNMFGYYYVKNGLILLIFEANSKFSLNYYTKKAHKRLKFIHERKIINPFFNSFSFISSNSFKDINDVDELVTKAKYLIQHLNNKRKFEKYSTWLIDDLTHDKHYQEFKTLMLDYEKKNELQQYIKESIPIILYKDNRESKVSILKNRIVGYSDQDAEFFNNVSWNRLIYTSRWNKYLMENCEEDENIILITNEYDLVNLNNYNRPKTTLLIKSLQNGFNYSLINNAFNNLNEGVNLGLYIEKINDRLINYVNIGNIKVFVISEKICKDIEKDQILYIKLLNFVKTISTIKNHVIIYQNLPSDLDQLMVEKLNVQYICK
ncbi:hypothetical protein NPA07_02840 [Mycoplasmopsis caviae]|uniref:Uncharacterized protein n=1 Tax=Mycoplasmopsis caviae TaxID=55603 RepID=A0A3P8MDZ5_9BACT|nr:hypothetical protein [Mycoplasmopsis caviae]UUD34736.1 hypothetical protein NPA07_02840 [Mycoplasmopsis caviae]VDR42430.1 Uncharacterised protein [Mycoplasmopsis caviae]